MHLCITSVYRDHADAVLLRSSGCLPLEFPLVPECPFAPACPLEPLAPIHGIPALTVPNTSCANLIPGSCGSIWRQRAVPNTQAAPISTEQAVPAMMISARGGKNLRSGTSG